MLNRGALLMEGIKKKEILHMARGALSSILFLYHCLIRINYVRYFRKEKGIYNSEGGLTTMKRRLKIRDLVDLVITRNYKEFQAKYPLSRKNLNSLKQAPEKREVAYSQGCAE